jgi:hypothetical protein
MLVNSRITFILSRYNALGSICPYSLILQHGPKYNANCNAKVGETNVMITEALETKRITIPQNPKYIYQCLGDDIGK